jgi:PilZ domain
MQGSSHVGHGRRRAARTPAPKAGKVILEDGSSTIDCLPRNVSLHGARLRFAVAPSVPDTFLLLLVRGQIMVPVARTWQRERDVGVRFTGAPRPVARTTTRPAPA